MASTEKIKEEYKLSHGKLRNTGDLRRHMGNLH